MVYSANSVLCNEQNRSISMKILLVDDSQTMRNIIKTSLKDFSYGIEFIEAEDGVKGLAAFNQHDDIQLAIVDWNMPNMDGLEMIRKVRSSNKQTVIIMCTTEAEQSAVIDAMQAGVNNYMIKPFTPASLLDKVTSTLKKASVL